MNFNLDISCEFLLLTKTRWYALVLQLASPSAEKVDAFLFKSAGLFMLKCAAQGKGHSGDGSLAGAAKKWEAYC